MKNAIRLNIVFDSYLGMMRPPPRVDYGRFVPVCVYFAPRAGTLVPATDKIRFPALYRQASLPNYMTKN